MDYCGFTLARQKPEAENLGILASYVPMVITMCNCIVSNDKDNVKDN
jgi:hypothetical protein